MSCDGCGLLGTACDKQRNRPCDRVRAEKRLLKIEREARNRALTERRCSMSEELKPCPFCGGKGSLAWDWLSCQRHYDFIRCQNCGARTGDFLCDKDKAIAAWNTRPDSAQLATVTAD